MQKLLFSINLTRVGPELRLTYTKCEAQGTTGRALWVSEMADSAAGVCEMHKLPATKPVRALLILLLRDLPKPPAERPGLLGSEGSHAASLHEVAVRSKDKKGDKTWFQKMFTNPNDVAACSLSSRLFRHGRPGGRFFVGVGPAWEDAKVKVRLDGKEVPTAQYAELADLVERWDAKAQPESSTVPLNAALELLVRDPATGQFTSVIEKPSLHPVKGQNEEGKGGDDLQVRVRLNRPAYICLVWVDQEGEPFPMFPWTKLRWTEFAQLQPRSELTVPEQLNSAGYSDLTVSGPPGVETLIIMVSEAKPTPEVLKDLPGLLRIRRPGIKPDDLRKPVISMPPKTSATHQSADDIRGPAVRKWKDPVEAFHGTLAEPLAACFDCVVLLTFANAGPAPRAAERTI